MNLRRTAVLAAVLFAASAAVVPSASASAGTAHKQRVCLATTAAPSHELTLRLPSTVVDWLVEHTRSYRGPCVELGDGELTAYSQAVGSRPVSVGLIMTDGSLDDLPHDPPSDGMWCFDKNSDGTADPMTECSGGYEKQLELGAI